MYADATLPHYLRSRLPADRAAKILDFGCGFGQTLRGLSALGYANVTGIDIEKEALAYCRSQGLNVIDGTQRAALAGLEGSLDLIVMTHVLEHIPKEQIIPTLKSLAALLKRGGSLFVAVPNAQANTGAYWAYEDFTHTTLFTAGSLFFVLSKAGFGNIDFVDADCLEGLRRRDKLLRRLLLAVYRSKIDFWNWVTGSSFHKPSPQIFSYEIKALATPLDGAIRQ